MALTANIRTQLIATLTSALDLVTSQAALDKPYTFTFANGTGANQANQAFSDQRTLAASATENLDLAGSLTNALGATITFTKVKALAVFAAAANTNDVLVGGAASAQFASMFGDVTDVVKVKPGGLLLLVAPDATGYAVTATSADLLKIANSAGSTSVTYDIVIIGVE